MHNNAATMFKMPTMSLKFKKQAQRRKSIKKTSEK
jgi:hypothetical protein